MAWNQSSYFLESGQGCLYLVPTPIGNLQDITFRALEVLKKVDYIAAEDTRHTKKLLHYYQIEKRLVSYHEHNKEKRGEIILSDVQDGKQIALVTDAGMPGISDPGEDIVRLAMAKHISVISLPGANAALTALIASGLSSTPFTFYGFLPRNKKKREEELYRLRYSPYTLILYEAPHRLRQTIASIHTVLGDRQGALVRELSKKHEEYIRGSLSYLLSWSEQTEIRGEFCLVIEGNQNREEVEQAQEAQADVLWWQELSLEEHVQFYIQQEYTNKEAIKSVAKERSLPKREVYQAFHLKES